jgi:hypothetical protein
MKLTTKTYIKIPLSIGTNSNKKGAGYFSSSFVPLRHLVPQFYAAIVPPKARTTAQAKSEGGSGSDDRIFQKSDSAPNTKLYRILFVIER